MKIALSDYNVDSALVDTFRVLPNSRSQFGQVTRTVVNGNYNDSFFNYSKINSIRKPRCERFASVLPNNWELFRCLFNSDKSRIDFLLKAGTQPDFVAFVPRDRVVKLLQCGRLEPDRPDHCHPYFFFKFARTCSQGTLSSGFFRASSARRSSSAINSGDSSSSRSPKRASTISRRSSGGNSRALARISVALMGEILTEIPLSGKLSAQP